MRNFVQNWFRIDTRNANDAKLRAKLRNYTLKICTLIGKTKLKAYNFTTVYF